MPDHIPHEVRRFILANIDSIAQLEALLILRANPQHKWACKDVAERIYLTEKETEAVLGKLATRALIETEKLEPINYCYQPKSKDVAALIDQLAETYAKYLVPVTNLIHQKPRRDIFEMADAFRLKSE
jgi:hypothetical protein